MLCFSPAHGNIRLVIYAWGRGFHKKGVKKIKRGGRWQCVGFWGVRWERYDSRQGAMRCDGLLGMPAAGQAWRWAESLQRRASTTSHVSIPGLGANRRWFSRYYLMVLQLFSYSGQTCFRPLMVIRQLAPSGGEAQLLLF